MNKKQKILTGVMLPIFLMAGIVGAEDGAAFAFVWWFAVAIVYAAFFFLLGPTRPN